MNSGTNIGMWYALASTEYYNGGPLKPELMDAPMVNMLNGGHYDMGNDSNWAADEEWTRVQGPFFVYINNVSNTITDPIQASSALYNDAVAQGTAEATAWPYSWFNNPTYDAGYAQASQRGNVTGKMVINDLYNPNASPANLWVGVVQQPSTTTNTYDFQEWYKPYQFWVKTDGSGNFTIPKVIAGTNYTLYAFDPGAAGTFMSQNQTGGNPPLLYNLPAAPFSVPVTGGSTTSLGNVTWTPARVGPTVFEIGYPDRTSRKFRHGDDWWVGDIGPSPTTPSPIWTKFLEYPFDFPNGLNYVVGQSRWTTDWNFVQPIVVDSAGNSNPSTSTITFNLASAPANGVQASIYLGISSAYYGPTIVSVNGTNLGNTSGVTSVPSGNSANGFSPSYSNSDTTVREGISAVFSDERLTFPGNLLHAGTNTITINMRKGGYFANHIMYDYVRLELPGYVPPAPASVAAYAGNNSVLLSWPVKPGATSYNVLRSITSGTNYSPIASGTSAVIGPVSGSGPANATYLDTTATNGTTYYYVVQSVNTTGTSVNSPQSSGIAPSGAPITVPAAPSGVAATGTNGSVTVTWNASTGANYYTVLRSTLADKIPTFTPTPALTSTTTILSTITLSNSVTGTTFTDTAVTNGTKYAYVVQATNAAGTSGTSTAYIAKPVPTAPSAVPAGVTATPGAQQITLSWSAVAGATGYIVQVATKSGGPYTYVSSVTTLTYTDGGQADNTKYYYVISAVNVGGTSANSAEVSATTAPAPPTNLAVTPGNTQATLTWTAATAATSYVIQRSTTTGKETTIASGVVGTTYTDSGLTNSGTYYYVVDSTNANGTGVDSSEVSVTPTSAVPVAPTGLTATGSNAQVTLNWNASSGATSYILKRGTASGGPYSTTVVSGLAATTYVNNTGLTNGTTYYYVVLATGTGGTGAYSAQASATPIAPPLAPTGLTASGSNAQVTLNWSASAGATGYILKRGTASGQETVTVNSAISGTTYTNTGLTNGTTYYYVVSGSNAGGTSGNSNEASAKPAQTYSQWIIAAFPGQSDPLIIGNSADPDKDGVANLAEYFMGTNPASKDAVPLTCALDGQGNVLLYFRMAKNLANASYSVDKSTDLSSWSSTGLQGTVVTDMGTYYMMKATIPIGANTKLFLRLTISSP